MAKSVGQWVGTIGGAVVGFFAGGNVALGAAIGGVIGGAIDPPKGPDIVGPRVDDLKVQTATYGAIKPRAYGTVMVSGNVFWIEGDQIREVSTTEEQQGGKGGGGSEVTTYSYYATFAVGLCKGPITGIRRLWIGDELVYSSVNAADSGADEQQLVENALSAGESTVKWTLFNGTDTQGPCTRMQADKGAGNVSSYPGEAYIVFEDLNLSKWSNTMVRAQVKAEIVVDGAYAVSDVEMSNFPKYNESAGYGGAIWQQTRLIWAGIFDDTGITTISWMYRDPDGYSVAIEFERQEFNYKKTLTNRTIGRYEMGGGFNDWFGLYVLCQSDEDMLISVQGSSGSPDDFTLGFHTPGASVWWPSAVTWAGLPLEGYSVIHLGRYFIGGNGYVFEVSQGGVIRQSVAITTYWMVASENYLFVLTTQNIGSGTTTIKKLSKVDLSVVATYDQTTYGQGSIQIIDDDSFYTTGYQAGVGNYLYKWVGGVVVSTALVGSASSIASKNFRVVNEAEKIIFYTPQFWQSSSVPAPGIRMSFQGIDDSPAKLRDIITAECGLVGIEPSYLTLTTLTDSDVRGFKLASVAAVRSGFDPLQAAFPFDAYQAGYKVKFVSRGGASIGSIPEIDLGANADGNNHVLLPTTREMDTQLPSKVSVVFMNSAREYDSDEQYAERLNVSSVAERRVELAIVLTPMEAAKIADVLLAKDWLERTALGPFALPPTWAHLEPSDVVTISHRGASYEARITRIEYRADGSLECLAVLSAAATYTSTAAGAESLAKPPMLIELSGITEAYLLDMARIREDQDVAGVAYGLMGAASGWPGAALVRSDDSGASYQAVGSTNSRAQVFVSTSALGAADSYSINNAAVLTLTAVTPSATLSSVTEDQLFAGETLAAYGAHGRWEIVAFKTVSESGGIFTLTDFIRGMYGTEQHTGTHATGDLFIRLTAALGFMPLPVSAIGSPRLYRAVTQGRPIDSAIETTFTADAVCLKPLSPVDLDGWRNPATFDWTISAVRRTRNPVEVFSGAVVPLGETSEQYDVEIWDSGYSTLKRQKSALSTLSATYTSAEQIADFGANQETVYVKAYQVSSVVGRGYPLVASIYRHASADPLGDQVKLFMPCSANLNDLIGHTVTAVGGMSVSGGWAVSDGVDDYIYLDSGADFNPGQYGEYTFEARIYPLSLSRTIIVFDTRPYATNGLYLTLYIANDGSINFFSWSVAQMSSSAGVIAINNEYHIALCRSGGTSRIFVDGVVVASFADSLIYVSGGSGRPTLAAAGDYPATSSANIKLKDIRYTAAARYSSAFTPPASPLPTP